MTVSKGQRPAPNQSDFPCRLRSVQKLTEQWHFELKCVMGISELVQQISGEGQADSAEASFCHFGR